MPNDIPGEKPPSAYTMCEMRMKEEGRGPELKALTQKYKDDAVESGIKFHWQTTRVIILKEMGYLGAEGEAKLWEERQQRNWMHVENAKDLEAKQARQITTQINREKRAGNEFEQAIATLPSEAPESVVIKWIETHPAMSLLSRSKDKTIIVRITAADLLNAPHGQCPSMKAARDLQHWANNAPKFYADRQEMMRKAVIVELALTKPEEESEELAFEYQQSTAEIQEMLSHRPGIKDE